MRNEELIVIYYLLSVIYNLLSMVNDVGGCCELEFRG